MALDHNENSWPNKGAAANDGVDVKYDHSGTTTIQIVGTPVTERKQMFEGGSVRKEKQVKSLGILKTSRNVIKMLAFDC